MRDIAQVFRTVWERAGEIQFYSYSYSVGRFGRITNRNGRCGGEQAAQIRAFGRGNGIIGIPTSAGQRSGVALPIALMIGAAKIYFIVFGILTIAGGVLGYVKAGSMASIIAGSISGVLLLLAAWLMPEHQAAGLIIALIVSLLLAGQFIPKFFRPLKVMPAGLMSVLSAIGIIVAIAAWLRK